MSRHSYTRYIWIGTIGFVLACTCSQLSSGAATLSSIASAIPSALPGNSTAALETIPALTPNPLTVHPTLDTAHAVSDTFAETGVNRDSGVTAKLTGGGDYDVVIPGALLTRDTDGSFLPAFGTALTVTPVSAIGGIPFSNGFLVALQITPEGLMSAAPGTITLNLPATYNPTDLVGFAADAAGTNFHLYPIQASSYSGITNIRIAVTHFSIYGVAQATQAEITAQQAHTPQTTESQDDDLLVAPDPTKTRNQLSKVHDRSVKPAIDKLDNLAGDCNFVTNTAYQFEHWNAQVDNLLQTNYFKSTVTHDANILAERLKECLKKTCPPCLAGKKADKKNANTFIVQATFMGYMDTVLDKMDDFNKWLQLANQCAGNAGLPLPEPPVADCGGGPQCGATGVPPTCP